MFKPSLLAASVAACSSFAFAAETVLPVTVVTASRLPQAQSDVIGDVTVINRQQLDNYRGQSLADVLVGQPGIQMSGNGGAGSTSSIFIRGTNSSHTLVLIDGIRHGSVTLGTPTLQHLPADQIDHIEILRGPAASLYGSDAIGGVIQIFTRKGNAQAPVSLSLGAGSENTRQASLTVYQKTGSTEVSTTLVHQETDGISAFADTTDPLTSDEDGYRNASASINATHTFAKGHEFGASLLLAEGHHQYDNAYAMGYNSHDKVRESAGTLWSRNQISDLWTSKVQFGQSVDDSIDFGPASFTDFTDSEQYIFTTTQQQASWINELALPANGILTLGAEGLKQEVSGTSDFEVKDRRINSLMMGYLASLDTLSIQVNLRQDRNSQFGKNKSFNTGLSWSFLPDWQVGASAGSGFKAPTFNDLYWPADPYSIGNPDLKPETSRSQEVFLRLSKASVQSALTLYHNKVEDLIVWDVDPTSYLYMPDNLAKGDIKGLTYTLDWQANILSAGLQYDYLKAVNNSGDITDGNQLIQRAKNSGKVYAGFKQDNVSARFEVQAQDKRYNDMANTIELGGYSIVNLSGSWQVSPELALGLRLNNALDKSYTLADKYSTYGRNGLLSLTWQPK